MWLKQQTGKERTPFITVGHDGWDSKYYDMLGVCIHFVDILNGKNIQLLWVYSIWFPKSQIILQLMF